MANVTLRDLEKSFDRAKESAEARGGVEEKEGQRSSLTTEQCYALCAQEWWENHTPLEIVALQLYEPRLICKDFGIFHEAIEKAMEHPVWTHQIVDPVFRASVKEKYPNIGEVTRAMRARYGIVGGYDV